jgi:hypothetical protein
MPLRDLREHAVDFADVGEDGGWERVREGERVGVGVGGGVGGGGVAGGVAVGGDAVVDGSCGAAPVGG